MTFDYFNTSYLAFGDKLKKTFKSLGGLLDSGYSKFDSLSNQLSFISNYLNKNYQVQNPIDGDSPCNCGTIYKVLSNSPLGNLTIDPYSSGNLKGIQISLTFFNPVTNKLCFVDGAVSSTEDKEIISGSAFLIPSVLNNNFTGKIVFFKSDEDKILSSNSIKLFDFNYISEENNIVLNNVSDYINVIPGTINRAYSNGSVIDITEDYIGNPLNSRKLIIIRTIQTTNSDIIIKVKYNGDKESTTVYSLHPTTNGKWSMYALPLYLNEGDVIEENSIIDKIYEIRYT